MLGVDCLMHGREWELEASAFIKMRTALQTTIKNCTSKITLLCMLLEPSHHVELQRSHLSEQNMASEVIQFTVDNPSVSALAWMLTSLCICFCPRPNGSKRIKGIKFFTHGEARLGGRRQFPGRPRLHRRPQIRKSRILFRRRKKRKLDEKLDTT